MLTRVKVQGFKSLGNVEVVLPRFAVLFGPNAVGKSNLLDAIQALSRIGTCRTLSDALAEPIRGYPVEAFGFPSGGLAALLSEEKARFSLEADLKVGREGRDAYRYRVEIEIQPDSGRLTVFDEYLTMLSLKGDPKGTPRIEKDDNRLLIRRKSKPGNPRSEPLGLNYAMLSDPRFAGVEYKPLERCRQELSGWRVYYLDPRVAMRAAKTPAVTQDIGVSGENIAPFLYHLRAEMPKNWEAVKRTLRCLVPGVEDLSVELDKRRGTLDITVRQSGTEFSSRVVSEGTLRVLALCAIAANPWGGSLVAFEEPENGVHPRRLELIAELLASLALEQHRQIIVTTHSPLFCEEVLEKARKKPDKRRRKQRGMGEEVLGKARKKPEGIILFRVRAGSQGTEVDLLNPNGPLFAHHEIRRTLDGDEEHARFEALLLRGLLDD